MWSHHQRELINKDRIFSLSFHWFTAGACYEQKDEKINEWVQTPQVYISVCNRYGPKTAIPFLTHHEVTGDTYNKDTLRGEKNNKNILDLSFT